MTISRVYRISGLASLVGSITFATHIVLRSVITAGLDPSAFAQQDLWMSINLLGVFGAALVAASAPLPAAFLIAFIAGLAAWIAGAMLLAVPFIRGRGHPRWIGYLLPASALWMIIGNLVIAPSGPVSNLVINLLSNLGPVLLVIGVSYLGSQMLSE